MQTTNQGFKYVEPADAITDFPAVDQSNWKLTEARTPRRVTSAQMTALTGLVDGQEIELEVDAAAGIYWRFRYRPASANASKWEFVGGPPLVAEILTSETDSTNNAWVDLATVGPSLTLPRAGDYDYDLDAGVNGVPTLAYSYSLGLSIAGAAPAAADTVSVAGPSTGGATIAWYLRRAHRLSGLAAGAVLKTQYKIVGFGGTYISRRLAVTPVRVA